VIISVGELHSGVKATSKSTEHCCKRQTV